MRRALGALLILHGLAHVSAGTWATGVGPVWITTALWALAFVGLTAAGPGLLGLPVARDHWRALALAGAGTSMALVTSFGHPALLVGLAIDALIMLAVARAAIVIPAPGATTSRPRRALRALGRAGAWGAIVYATALIVLRPWYTTWGATPDERAATLPGDELIIDPHYRMDHAITIHAPADSVWPWLVQIGQDRGGFYSYEKLERAIGARIRNVDSIHPEWQTLRVGDFVRATQPDYLGGRLGDHLGWRVIGVEQGRAILLEGWGAFVLDPVDEGTTRLIIRTRGDGTPSVTSTLLAPFGLLVFEPAHFIMQRGMMLGIKARAERWAVRAIAGA
jgi:hypothetical protein